MNQSNMTDVCQKLFTNSISVDSSVYDSLSTWGYVVCAGAPALGVFLILLSLCIVIGICNCRRRKRGKLSNVCHENCYVCQTESLEIVLYFQQVF